MAALTKKSETKVERAELFDRFDRMFDGWTRDLSLRWPGFLGHERAPDMIRVDEFREDGDLVVRAEVPGIDPEKDVELTVIDGMLHIDAERREEEAKEEKGYVRRELRYGSFFRMLPLPDGVTETDITASYKDGILEVRIPVPEVEPTPTPAPATKIPITKS